MSNDSVNNALCTSCNKRELCRTLCPEAELFVSQDQVDWCETPAIHISQDKEHLAVFEPKHKVKTVTLSTLETKVTMALSAGYNRTQICVMLGLSRPHLRKVIHDCKAKWEKET